MHPVVRIVTFVVLAAFLAVGRTADLACGALVTLGLYGVLFPSVLPVAVRSLYRTRWLFLSLFVVYAWFTPGQALVATQLSALNAWLPSREGLMAGASRALSLALIIMAAQLLLRSTTQPQLLAALLWLTRPLRLFGLPHDRFAVRLMLSIEYLGEVRTLVAAALADHRGRRRALGAVGGFAADVFGRVVDSAQRTPARTISLPVQLAPPLYHWLYPLTLSGVFAAAGVAYP
jgi:AcrR family transcriptional regulator